MRYEDVLPPEVARKQRAWERDSAVMRARKAGVTLREIGENLGISVERVRQLECRAYRRERRGEKSPIELYFERSRIKTIAAVYRFHKFGRLVGKYESEKSQWTKPIIETFMEFSMEPSDAKM